MNNFKIYLSEIFDQVLDVDEQIYCLIIQKMRKEKISDCIEFLSKLDTQKLLEEQLKMSKEIQLGKNSFNKIINIIKLIQHHYFNKYNYSEEIYIEIKEDLIKKTSQNKKIIQFFQFLVLLAAIDNNFIQCGSNSLNFLVQMKVDLTNQNFENINIQNTSLVGANFVGCNLNQLQFENVDISGINLNGAQLFNCGWKNLIRLFFSNHHKKSFKK
ncbi:unnamed protein product [Paramecium pentaurelia]|uniref:Pentapeptide repeat-containing protein n=1 Tax=Paramecium pentaurelia TaxID=43138 RepID=A0A8S1WNC4_9CILI|nr:unnamed protein product [Paramecium pentaurelia]